MVRLLVVEDHALVREGLMQALRQLDNKVKIEGAADYDSACSILAKEAFDLALLDLGLPGLDGFSCLRKFRQNYPKMAVVILSAYDDQQTIAKAMKAGAAGFVSKAYSTDQLLAVLRDALTGEVVVPDVAIAVSASASLSATRGKGMAPASLGLTDRQAEVLGLMAKGKSNRDIAEILGLSEGTVKIHLTAIFKLLGVSSRTQAMVVIAQRGLRL